MTALHWSAARGHAAAVEALAKAGADLECKDRVSDGGGRGAGIRHPHAHTHTWVDGGACEC